MKEIISIATDFNNIKIVKKINNNKDIIIYFNNEEN